MTVAIDAHAAVAGQRRALGVVEPLVEREPGRLAGARTLDRFLGLDRPGVVELEVGDVAREQRGIGEPGAVVGRGVAGDRRRLGDRLAHGRGRNIRGAGRALALAEIDGDGEAAVAVVLDRVDLAHAHRRREAALQAGVGFGLAGAGLAGDREGAADDGLELGDTRRVDLL